MLDAVSAVDTAISDAAMTDSTASMIITRISATPFSSVLFIFTIRVHYGVGNRLAMLSGMPFTLLLEAMLASSHELKTFLGATFRSDLVSF